MPCHLSMSFILEAYFSNLPSLQKPCDDILFEPAQNSKVYIKQKCPILVDKMEKKKAL